MVEIPEQTRRKLEGLDPNSAVLLRGVSYSGKSTLARAMGWRIINGDTLRSLLLGDVNCQSANKEIGQVMPALAAIAAKVPGVVCVDNTHILWEHTHPTVAALQAAGRRVLVLDFLIPADFMTRKGQRDSAGGASLVPLEVLQRQCVAHQSNAENFRTQAKLVGCEVRIVYSDLGISDPL